MSSLDEEFEDLDSALETPEVGFGIETRLVSAGQVGQRLDQWMVAQLEGVTRAEVQRWITHAGDDDAGVRLNGEMAKSNTRLRVGDVVTIVRPAAVPSSVSPEAIPLDIVYEDADLMVINKPRGMVVHPAPGAPNGTLVNAVLAHAADLSGIGGELRPGIVHRLDKDTGGLILVAKNDHAHRSLQAQIQAKTAERHYQALVWGVPRFREATVDAPIGRHPVARKKMAVLPASDSTARPARTDLTVQRVYRNAVTLLEARLHTGRTHQIRVHCAYIQHPIVGDPVYGGSHRAAGLGGRSQDHPALEIALAELNGQALHAYSLSFDHPQTGERLTFASPLPAPFQALIDLLDQDA
jgi:23S rRNA pseudouridine1911/1915/1917 synthase